MTRWLVTDGAEYLRFAGGRIRWTAVYLAATRFRTRRAAEAACLRVGRGRVEVERDFDAFPV